MSHRFLYTSDTFFTMNMFRACDDFIKEFKKRLNDKLQDPVSTFRTIPHVTSTRLTAFNGWARQIERPFLTNMKRRVENFLGKGWELCAKSQIRVLLSVVIPTEKLASYT